MCKTLLLIPSDPTWSDKSLRQSLRRAETGDKEGHLQRTQGRDFVGTATLWRQMGTHYICICKMLKGTLKNLISHSEVMPWLKLSSPRVVLHTVCHHHWLDISIMTSGTFETLKGPGNPYIKFTDMQTGHQRTSCDQGHLLPNVACALAKKLHLNTPKRLQQTAN